jgi:hypothetical protein
VYNNIQKNTETDTSFYSNCFNGSLGKGKNKGDTVVLAAGSGFTWEVIIKW